MTSSEFQLVESRDVWYRWIPLEENIEVYVINSIRFEISPIF